MRMPAGDSSGVYIYKSIVNDLRHGNYICTPEVKTPANCTIVPKVFVHTGGDAIDESCCRFIIACMNSVGCI